MFNAIYCLKQWFQSKKIDQIQELSYHCQVDPLVKAIIIQDITSNDTDLLFSNNQSEPIEFIRKEVIEVQSSKVRGEIYQAVCIQAIDNPRHLSNIFPRQYIPNRQ